MSKYNLFKTSLMSLALVAFFTGFSYGPSHAHAAAVSLTTVTVSSNNASTTLAKVGNTLTYSLTLSGTPASTSTPTINILNMGSTTMSGSGTSWSYSTTTVSAWSTGAVTFNLGWGGTVGEATTTITQSSLTGANVRFDKTAPTVTSITSNATATGVLKIGDTIVFTLTPGATEYGGSVTGSYNGTSLTWSSADSGATYTATATVTEGQTDQATALQISGVVLRDAAGNAASAAAGTDVVKTIDANSPSAPTASLPSGTYSGSPNTLTFSSTGSDSIRFTTDGISPTCSTGFTYSGSITLSTTADIKVVGCDNAGNMSAVSTFSYDVQSGGGSHGGGNGSGGGSGSGHATTVVYPTTPATTPAPATTPGATPMATAFARSLTVGSTGADVLLLQKFLNTHGFVIAASGAGSVGHETSMFGGLTKKALMKFQASVGISPASGYFGPLTRAYVASHN